MLRIGCDMPRDEMRLASRLSALTVSVAIAVFTLPALTLAQQGGEALSMAQLGAEILAGGTWLAEDIRGGGVIDNAQSTISFADDGRVSGSGGCNRLFGSARIDDERLVFGGVGTTRMACAPALMDQEQKFLAALSATRTFRIDGPFLRFYDDMGAELVRFTRLG